MSITKTGIFNNNNFIENGESLQNIGFSNGTSTLSFNNGIYTVTSPVSSSTWGAAFSITRSTVIVPYNTMYKIELEVNVPTAHTIVIDLNNIPQHEAAWAGNDNDLVSARTVSTFSIPANTWTKISWGSINKHASNTTQDALLIYDGIGLRTSNDSSAITWQFRNYKAKLYYNNNTVASIGKTFSNSNNFYEY